MLPVGTAGDDSPVAEDDSSAPHVSFFLLIAFSPFLRAGLLLI